MDEHQLSDSFIKKIKENGLTYLINNEEMTAKIIKCDKSISKIFIPRLVKYESKEYTIKGFSRDAINFANIESIQFAPDSEFETIEKDAFNGTIINHFSFPASLIDLKEGWCNFIYEIKTIQIDSNNPRYSYFDNKFIIGKSNESLDDYDVLVFAPRDIVKATIPPFIKTIGPYAFSQCRNLKQVEFPPNSAIQTIDKFAFYSSSIKSISIPESLIELKEGWCFCTTMLWPIQIDSNNPRYSYFDDKFIIGKSNESLDDYDVLVLAHYDIIKATIPPFIKIIGPYAFAKCDKLQQVEIHPNSKLQIIDKYAFVSTSIQSISIPPHVTHICEGAFAECFKLNHVEFLPNSELQIIGMSAFAWTSIKSILIPMHVTHICEKAFYNCEELSNIDIQPNSELQAIGGYAFNNSLIEKILIPPQVTQICEGTFYGCTELRYIAFPPNSKLKKIQGGAFVSTLSIGSIIIPEHVTHIDKNAFSYCNNLKIFEIQVKSDKLISSLCKSLKDCIIMIPK